MVSQNENYYKLNTSTSVKNVCAFCFKKQTHKEKKRTL